jgi:hypothetical protein
MAQIKPFKQFVIQESVDSLNPDDDIKQLRDLGLVDKDPFEDRFDKMVDEWGGDPEISAAIDILTKKTGLIINKWIDLADDEDVSDWEQRLEQLYNDTSVGDMGFLEFMVVNGLTD